MRRVLTCCVLALAALAACARGAPAPVSYGNGGSTVQRDDSVAGVTRQAPGRERTSRTTTRSRASAESVPVPPTRPTASAPGASVAAAPRPPEKPRGTIRATISRESLTRAGIHTVTRGQTVYELSRRYEVPIRSIIDANDLRPPFTLYVGQELRIPVPQRHVVRAGDTVYGISRAYGVDMSALTRVNDIQPPYTISPGQVLVIPGDGAAGATRTAATGTADRADSESQRQATRTRESTSSTASSGGEAASQGTRTASVAAPQPKEIPQPPPRSGGRFLWPLTGRVVADFGPQDGGLHNDGINIAAARGTPIRAAENGVVAYVGNELRGFGNLLLIKHADNWVTAYAHTDEILVGHGDQVRRGQIVARVGASGSVAEPQLHFEIRKGSKARDPRDLLGSQRAGK